MNNRYGPDAVCERTRCTADGPADHNGGAHLDPADRAHYDGISISHNAAPYRVKEATAGLLRAFGSLTGPPATTADSLTRAQVEIAVAACLHEIDRLQQQVAHVQVDADHKIREAARRALDCADHGQALVDNENTISHLAEAAERFDRARLALLGEHQAIREFCDRWSAHGLGVITVDQILGGLDTSNKRAAAAHQRAFSPPRTKETP